MHYKWIINDGVLNKICIQNVVMDLTLDLPFRKVFWKSCERMISVKHNETEVCVTQSSLGASGEVLVKCLEWINSVVKNIRNSSIHESEGSDYAAGLIEIWHGLDHQMQYFVRPIRYSQPYKLLTGARDPYMYFQPSATVQSSKSLVSP